MRGAVIFATGLIVGWTVYSAAFDPIPLAFVKAFVGYLISMGGITIFAVVFEDGP